MEDPEVDIEALAVRAAAGEAAAMDQLLSAIQPRVRRITERMLLHPQDAEEATQDALLIVATKLHTFRGASRFSTWLHAVTANSARATYRALKRRSVEVGADAAPVAVDPRTTSVIAGSRLDLLEALDTIGADHPELVEPLVLRDLQQLDYNEIARLLDVPLGTVKSRIHTARQRVRPLLHVTG